MREETGPTTLASRGREHGSGRRVNERMSMRSIVYSLALDGVRAVAVLTVMFFHLGAFTIGWAGVPIRTHLGSRIDGCNGSFGSRRPGHTSRRHIARPPDLP